MNTFLVVAAVMAAIAAAVVALPLLRDRQSRVLGALLSLAVIGAAAALYPLWSNWNWQAPQRGAGPAGPDVAAMVAKLELHLREQPDDVKGWLMLGRSYIVLQRLDDAVAAYDHARVLDSKNVDAALGLGEAMSLRAGGEIPPAAADLFDAALALAPTNPKALLYGGFAAAVRGDRALARSRWQALKLLHPPAQIEAVLDQRISELGPVDAPGAAPTEAATRAAGPGAGPAEAVARAAAAGPGARSAPPAAAALGAGTSSSSAGTSSSAGDLSAAQVTVNISLAPTLKSRLKAETPLFVFAREPDSQGPPLAAKRLSSSALGSQVQLSPADSMLPGRVLVGGRRVSVTARVSFRGQAIPAAGDLYGEISYEVGRDGARELVIDRITQ